MIIGHLKDIQLYKGLHPNLDTAIDYLSTTNLSALPLGKTVIDEERVFINHFHYQTLHPSDCLLEGHHHYLDIHLVLSGEECVGISHIDSVTPLNPYDEEIDFIPYAGDIQTKTNLTANHYVICFLEDIHMPKIMTKKNTPSNVDKIVVKVKL